MRLSTADDPINEGEIVSWTGWLMDDDSFDEMVEEVRRRHPIKNAADGLSDLSILVGLLVPLIIILIACAVNAPKSALGWCAGVALVVFSVSMAFGFEFCFFYQTPVDVLTCRRRDALQRLCKIPFVVDYRFCRKIETSDGEAYEYELSLSGKNDNDDLRSVLDVADIEFEFGAACPQPAKNKLKVMSKSAKVERISNGDDGRPTIKMRINGWVEI